MERIVLIDEDCGFAAALGRAMSDEGGTLRWMRTGDGLGRRIGELGGQGVVVDPGISGCLWYRLLGDLRRAAPLADLHVVTAFASSAMSRRAAEVGPCRSWSSRCRRRT